MDNPLVCVENGVLIVRRHQHHISLSLETDHEQEPTITCFFHDQDGKEPYSAVLAPREDTSTLANRIASYLSAYILVADQPKFEAELLAGIGELFRDYPEKT